MRPTTATDDNVFDFQALQHPGTASAIVSCPPLGAPEGLKAPVSIDAILEALCELDGGYHQPPGGKPKRCFWTARTMAA